MVITYLHYGHRPDDDLLARNLIVSAKAHMPDVEIFHQTDGERYGEDAWPRIIQLPRGEMTFSQYRVAHEIRALELFPEVLSVDIDCQFCADVREVFQMGKFDVALAEREPDDAMRAGFIGERWVGGVHFNRSIRFWRAVQNLLPQFPDPFYGVQNAMNFLAQYGGFEVLALPERTWNRRPRTPLDTMTAKILHYRGARKAWLLELLENGKRHVPHD